MQALLAPMLQLSSINDVRNGIIWCDVLEKAYTQGAFAIGVDTTGDYCFVLLDKHWAAIKLRDFAGGPEKTEQVCLHHLRMGLIRMNDRITAVHQAR